MNLTREIAHRINDEHALREVFAALASEAVARGHSRNRFDARIRRLLHSLHDAGYAQGKLRDIRRIARDEFHQAQLHPVR